jgi:septal ring-binding cell division protein DamX
MAVRESTQNQERSGGDPPAGGAFAKKFVLWGLTAVVTLVLIVGVGIGLSAAVRDYSRAEQRADAHNRVTLTHIGVARAEQQADITRAQIAATQADADKQFAQAVGIRRAQNEISRTLTGNYLQYEAIQAQKAIATSGRNNTLIYVPSGPNGVPLTQDPQNVNPLRPVPPR